MFRTRLLVVALLFGANYVQGTVYSSPSCQQQCTSEADFVHDLPDETGPVEQGDNRAYAWSIVALIQLKSNIKDISPPAAARVCGLVGTCLYEAAALYNPRYKSSVSPLKRYSFWRDGTGHNKHIIHAVKRAGFLGVDSFLRDGSGEDEQLIHAMDGAGFWAVRSLFGERASFDQVLSQYRSFSGLDIESLIPIIEAAVQHPRIHGKLIPDDRTAGIVDGALACQRVIEKYTKDGFNPDGTHRDDQPPVVDYRPYNLPQRLAGITDCDNEIKNPSTWQPLCIPSQPEDFGTTACTPQSFLAPFAGRYEPFALQAGDETSGDALLGPPPVAGTAEFRKQWEEVLEFSANLDDVDKIIAEYWADGPDSTAPPGHFFKIAADAALSENLDVSETARLLFIVGSAVYDAGIASWRTKTTFDLIRPLQMIQCGEFRGQERLAWKGRYQGILLTNISEWRPYQATDFVTPPFAAYTSGHSTFSSAAAEALRLFFGDDAYRGPRCHKTAEGASLFEPKSSKMPGISDVPNSGPMTPGYVPADDVVLCWDTYTAAADEAGTSRLLGGIHIRADDVAGQILGRSIGSDVFDKAQELLIPYGL